MSNLTWGKPKLETWKCVQNTTPTPVDWSLFPDPKQDSAKLTTGKGTKLEALIEGGQPVDVLFQKNKFTFECEIFVTKGQSKPIPDTDGVIDGFYSIRLTPEDDTLEGWVLDRTKVSVETTWTSKEGTLLKYTFEALEPSVGKVLKSYTETYEVQRGLSLIGSTINLTVDYIDSGDHMYLKTANGVIYSSETDAIMLEASVLTSGQIVIAYPKSILSLTLGDGVNAQFAGVLNSNLPISFNAEGEGLTEIIVPNATELYCNNCSELVFIDADKAVTVECNYSVNLESLQLPNAETVSCFNGSALKSINLPKATTIDASSNELLVKVNIPNGSDVNLSSCILLEKVTALKATNLNVSGCSILNEINIRDVETLTATACAVASAKSMASIFAAIRAKGFAGGSLDVSEPNNQRYLNWTQQAKNDKIYLAETMGWEIIYRS
jgi:hypothetical protein